MSEERRRHLRYKVVTRVRMTWEGHEPVILVVRDLSVGGLFVERGEVEFPPCGTVVELKLEEPFAEGEPPTVKAKIVRITDEGAGVQFEEN